jgi:hypothetical protein
MYCRPDTRVANALEAEDIVTRPDAALPAQATKCHLLLAIVTTDRTPSTRGEIVHIDMILNL